jgi:hypothetical protein
MDKGKWSVEPVVHEVHAGWMARTPDWHPYRIAVIEPTPEQARQHFAYSLDAWRELHERRVTPPVEGED